MTNSSSSTSLTANLRAVLPIGIPVGWSSESDAPQFIVRRGGFFCYLDPEAYQVWATAFCGPDPAALIDHLASTLKHDVHALTGDIRDLTDHRLLLQLSGDWRDDWLRLAPLRIIPRAAILSSDQTIGYRLLLKRGDVEMRLDLADHSIWAFWDGIGTIKESVYAAMESCGYARPFLQERAHALLVATLRAGAIFIDCHSATKLNGDLAA